MNNTQTERISFAGLRYQRYQQNNEPSIYPRYNQRTDYTFKNIKNIQTKQNNLQAQSFSGRNIKLSKTFQILKNKQISHILSPRLDNDSSSCSESSYQFTSLVKQLNTSNHSSKSQVKFKNIQQPNRSMNLNINNSSKMNTKINQKYIEQMFTKAQNKIKQQIDQFNNKYLQIGQILADLHIKDLMAINQILKRNQEHYSKLLLLNDKKIMDRNQIEFNQVGSDDISTIYQIQKSIQQIITEKRKSFDFRSIFQQKNKEKEIVSGRQLKVSPRINKGKQIQFSNRLIKKASQNLQKISQPFPQDFNKALNISTKQNHYNLNNNEQTILDTPQSVKTKISYTSKIKTQKQPEIGMFDRINISESIQNQDIQQMINNQNNSKIANLDNCQPFNNGQKNKGKRDYRYGRSSQQ